ncbi:hypothetical protein HZQ67_06025 [Elizabethkingia anophelis]|nr:hypothetical protein [Elizabethkingia anophelis]MDV3500890.1 hypothetical protein [Elizabethkingia anophelis]
MNIKLNEYLDIFDPIKREYFPIRVISFTEKGILAKFLNPKREREIQLYYIKNYGYKKSFINNELLENCGFKKENELEYHKENKIIIECLIGQLKPAPYPFYLGYESNYFGYKFLNSHSDSVKFKEILLSTDIQTSIEDFKSEHSTTTNIETLRDFINLSNDEFDEIYLENFNRKQ